ncbi:MAG: ABC transporter ATP-binding protein [Terrisporobacter sp.]|uniref:ABC transporter ATP-binding protein n=1 Tax=Terrisporobacter sp. TaxID=1965305 RepID=UPI002A48164B|nr:ABC transporter ATP-binding protein [Terrisporobacter sp.]MDD5878679.1 ABC transporter ATP-binding protein [Clostridiales bacterium]MDY6152532.1 ABC transporter ATP-binding protein [Terrisporobacter sp.]
MLKIFKHLRNSSFIIFIIILLLAGQASCELSLPTYTSNIINIGIQQSGIENSVPEVIRKSEMDKLFIFLSDKNKNTILNNYKLLNKNSLSDEEYNKYKDSYPALSDEEIYLLNTKDKDIIKKLDNILGKPELIVYGLESDDESAKMIQQQMKNNMTSNMSISNANQNLENMDMFAMLQSMPKKQKNNLIKEMDNQLINLPDAMISQSAVSFVKNEYNEIGIDTGKLQTQYILTTGAEMIGITILSVVAAITVGFLASRVGASLGRTLRSKTFEKVMRFSSKEMTEFSTASLITRSTNDIQQIQQMTVMMLRMVFFAPFMAIGGIYKALSTNASMAWIIGVAVLGVVVIVGILFATVMPRFKKLQNLVDRLNLVTREILTGLPVIRAFSTERFEEKRFDGVNKDLTKVNMFVNRMMSCMMPAMMLVMNAISVLIVWVGAKNIDTGAMQVGDMMAFIQYTMQIVMSFLMISMISVMLPRAAVSANRINEVLEKDIIIKEDKNPQAFDASKKGLVEFKNVSFKYPDADEDILHDINFTANSGETTAFIGSTGSGKSTLINLILRFHDVTKGEIKVDGVNIKNVRLHDLREKIGYVPQKGVLFSGTIDSNLRYGKKDATQEDIIKAAKIAQSIDFINDKEDKFDSEISQGGSNVSGGQKQRLSIARAIAKDPEIFIFDDSFSALDFKTDAKLRKALKSETSNSTVLIVAQRISTILDADQIVVLDEGRIVGKGTHKELLKNCEIYKEIALSQLSKEELENE